jgi:glycosyltransferase involved in cell wall biosynthesis
MPRPILFLNPVGTIGGAERILLDLLAVLRTTRPDCPSHVITGTDGPLCEEICRLGITAEVVKMPAAIAAFGESALQLAAHGKANRGTGLLARAAAAGAEVPKYVRRLRRAVARIRPRLVHSNGLKSHLLAGYVVPSGLPVVWHIHDFLTTRPILGRVLRRLAIHPSVAIANSQATAADTRRAVPGVRVETVYNGVDTDYFAPGPADGIDLDRLAGLPPAQPGTVRVGLVATYARWKGQDVFLDAAAVPAAGPPVRFYVIGGPIYQTAGSQFSETELLDMIAGRGLGGRAGLIPFRLDLPPIYRSLDVVVHASTRPEPFGRTIVEAMACGRAVVVANAGGAAELFSDGCDAIGVPPSDSAALSAALRGLIADPLRRAGLGTNARQTAVARFSRVRMVEQTLAVYESTTRRHRVGAGCPVL